MLLFSPPLILLLSLLLLCSVVSGDANPETKCVFATAAATSTLTVTCTAGKYLSELVDVAVGDIDSGYSTSICEAGNDPIPLVGTFTNTSNLYDEVWFNQAGCAGKTSCNTKLDATSRSSWSNEPTSGVNFVAAKFICTTPTIVIVNSQEGKIPKKWHKKDSLELFVSLTARPDSTLVSGAMQAAVVKCQCSGGIQCSSTAAYFTASDGPGRYNVPQSVFLSVLPTSSIASFSSSVVISCYFDNPLTFPPDSQSDVDLTCLYDDDTDGCSLDPVIGLPAPAVCTECPPTTVSTDLTLEGKLVARLGIRWGDALAGPSATTQAVADRIQVDGGLVLLGTTTLYGQSLVRSLTIPNTYSLKLGSASQKENFAVPSTFSPGWVLGRSVLVFGKDAAANSIQDLYPVASTNTHLTQVVGCSGFLERVEVMASLASSPGSAYVTVLNRSTAGSYGPVTVTFLNWSTISNDYHGRTVVTSANFRVTRGQLISVRAYTDNAVDLLIVSLKFKCVATSNVSEIN